MRPISELINTDARRCSDRADVYSACRQLKTAVAFARLRCRHVDPALHNLSDAFGSYAVMIFL